MDEHDRFGEEAMQSCEVMLHDIEDSKRVNNAVCAEISKNAAVNLSRDSETVSNTLLTIILIILITVQEQPWC